MSSGTMSDETVDVAAAGGAQLNYEDWSGVDEMRSLCMRCGAEGMTRMLLHKIPYFREIIVASFACDECGERNNEVTFGGEIQPLGARIGLTVTCSEDMDRQLIKSDSAAVRIKELDFEIPPMTQRGGISTIEGVLSKAAENLSMHQAERLAANPEVGIRVAHIIMRLQLMAQRDPEVFPFTIEVDDPAGNSFVENPTAPLRDPHMTEQHYPRTREQDIALGLNPSTSNYKDDRDANLLGLARDGGSTFGQVKQHASDAVDTAPATDKEEESGLSSAWADVRKAHGTDDGGAMSQQQQDAGVVVMLTPCPNCAAMGESRTAVTSIPHFKEVVIMAFECPECGYRDSDVKGGGGVPTYGSEVRLTVTNVDDLKRDVLKSDTAQISIPELDLLLEYGTLGGLFTTIEGLMNKIITNLQDANPFAIGDSSVLHHANEENQTRKNFRQFLDKLAAFARGAHLPFTVILKDPLGNSFISAPLGTSLPPEMDSSLKILEYRRSYEEDEELGLHDINTQDDAQQEDGIPTVVLPDRMLHPHKQGPDHPTPFAVGTSAGDDTQGGVYFGTSTMAVNEEETQPEYLTGPAGYSTEKYEERMQRLVNAAAALDAVPGVSAAAGNVLVTVAEDGTEYVTVVGKERVFTDDSKLKFIPREEFGGRRAGFMFRLGSQGLGYYEDPHQQQQRENS